MAPLLIGAIIAQLAGAALQYHAQQQARSRQQQSIQEALQRQRAYQQQAERAVMERVPDFSPEKRQQQQTEIKQRLEREMMTPVQEAQPGHQEASAVQGQLSSDYLKARAQSQANQMKSAQVLAQLLGQTMSAGQLRQQEGLGLMDAAQEVDRLSHNSQGMRRADEIAIQEAGVPSLWQTLLGGLLQTAGSAGMVRGMGAPSNSTPAWTGQANTNNNAIPSFATNFGNSGLWAGNGYGLRR